MIASGKPTLGTYKKSAGLASVLPKAASEKAKSTVPAVRAERPAPEPPPA
ncbi:unannotated protein [freshwater metagenome]|uniref:Unannotated protein n=1 Tax=freshwater metagenome TaxID=449393 RepID=A0A6J6W4U3_9ZZZZ